MASSSLRRWCWANSVPLSKVTDLHKPGWRGSEPGEELVCGMLRGLAGLPCQQGHTGLPFVRDEDGLAWGGEHHEIGFPVAEGCAVIDGVGPQIDGNTALDEVVARAPTVSGGASFGAALGQIVAPGSVVGAADLGVDEAVDALMADRRGGVLLAQPAGDLLGRPAEPKLAKHEPAQPGVALQARACPAPGAGLLVGIARLVADLCAACCASARERLSMARDPELPRSGGSIAQLCKDGQSCIAPRG